MEFLHFPELSWDIIESWGFSILYCPANFRFGYLGDWACHRTVFWNWRMREFYVTNICEVLLPSFLDVFMLY